MRGQTRPIILSLYPCELHTDAIVPWRLITRPNETFQQLFGNECITEIIAGKSDLSRYLVFVAFSMEVLRFQFHSLVSPTLLHVASSENPIKISDRFG